MPNAAKLKKKAAEFEQKKQFDKALQLYIQILDDGDSEDGEGDVALYNRVGDLLMRQGNVGDAMTYYEKAVDLYAESGFFNNAIALCNKILRQSPGRNSVYYKLGKISAKKGFISDAKQNFLEYASRMQTAGHLDEAFRALKEFADLCPDQDDIRLMLAEQLSKKDRKGEALEQLQVLYQKFETEGRGAEMRATVDRMRAIDPNVEPKTGGSARLQKSTDLVFIDLSDGSDPRGHPNKPGFGPGAPPPKPRTTVPLRPDNRPTAPVRAEPALEPPLSGGLPLMDAAPGDDEPLPSDDDADFMPLPPIEESDPAIEGLESTTTFEPDVSPAADQVSGYEPSALDDELADALDAALPEVDPPLSGQQFGALRLATPLYVPVVMPPAHDLALPGELPRLGDAPRSALSLTGEMELIIPESDAPASDSLAPRSAKSAGATTGAGADADRDRTEVPVLDVDGLALPSLELGPNTPPGGSDVLSLVGGAELLDVANVPDDSSESEDAPDETDAPMKAPFKRASSSETVMPSSLDDLGELPSWLAEPDDLLGAMTNALPGSESALRDRPGAPLRPAPRVSGPTLSQSPLARSADSLRARVEDNPTDWHLRRELAEALLDAGDRDGGLQALESAMVGLERAQDLEGARSVADEIIRLMPNSVRHHQKRVEYAFRTNDRARLPQAYIELADALFRAGQADKARAVYQRVLELSPNDARAQIALSTFGDIFLQPEAVVGPGAPSPASRGVRLPPPEPPKPAQPEHPSRSTRDTVARPEAPTAPRLTGPAPAGRAAPASNARRVIPRRPRDDAQPEGEPGKAGTAPSGGPGPRPAPPGPASPRPGAPGAPSAAPAQPAQPAKPAPSADRARPPVADGYINLGDWLRDDEAPRSTRMVVEDEKPTGDEAADFADMLRKFKQGIAQNVSEEDHDSHYDLGVAYKEMGLVDEAIAEFQKSLRGPEHRVRTYEALGQCFLEKEQFQVATTILGRALTEPGVTDDQLVGVLYLLGYASEALMQWEAAVTYYQRVFAVDIRFRDAAQRLATLERAPQ